MKIVIIGGTGLIGTQLVKNLSIQGHEVVAAAPSSGVNSLTGEGLEEVMEGADTVIDVSNSPSFESKAVLDFFTTSTKNLIASEKAAGVKNHVILSIVGIDRRGANDYFKAKLAQEDLVKASGLPYSILRSTQFFEFIGGIAESGLQDGELHVSPALFQPVASQDVVAALSGLAAASATNTTVEIAGPERMGMDELASRYLSLKGDSRKLVSDVAVGYFGAPADDTTLIPGANPIIGQHQYDQWVKAPGNLR